MLLDASFSSWALSLVTVAAKSGLLLAAAWLSLLVLGRARVEGRLGAASRFGVGSRSRTASGYGAGVRHGLLATALVGSLLLPAVGWILPEAPFFWTLPRPVSLVFEAETLGGWPSVQEVPVDAASGLMVLTSGESVLGETGGIAGDRPVARKEALLGEVPEALGEPARALAAPPASPIARFIAWLAIAFGPVWTLAALMVLARYAAGVGFWRRLVRGANQVVEPRSLALLQASCDRVGLSSAPRLVLSDEARCPMTGGWRSPVVVIPEGALEWSDQRLEMVLLHELTHIKRRDWLVHSLSQMAAVVYWFNPLVWLTLRRLAQERELACDEQVLALGVQPSSYAATLIELAKGEARWIPTTALEMARRKDLEVRVMSILDVNKKRSRGILVTVLFTLLLGLVPALAAIRPWEPGPLPGEALGSPKAPRPLARSSAPQAATTPEAAPAPRSLHADAQPMPSPTVTPEAPRPPVLEVHGEPVTAPRAEPTPEAAPRGVAPIAQYVSPSMALARLSEAHVIGDFEHLEMARIEEEMEQYVAQIEALSVEFEPLFSELEATAEELGNLATESLAVALSEDLSALESDGLHHEVAAAERHTLMEFRQAEIGRLAAELEVAAQRLAMDGLDSASRDALAALMDEKRSEVETLRRSLLEDQSHLRDRSEERVALRKSLLEQRQKVRRKLSEKTRLGLEDKRVELENLHHELEAQLAPLHRRLDGLHVELEPFRASMEELERSMEPLQRQLEESSRELERMLLEVAARIEQELQQELGSYVPVSFSFHELSESVLGVSGIEAEDDVITLRVSRRSLVKLLLRELQPVSGERVEEAVERAADRLIRLELSLDEASAS